MKHYFLHASGRDASGYVRTRRRGYRAVIELTEHISFADSYVSPVSAENARARVRRAHPSLDVRIHEA